MPNTREKSLEEIRRERVPTTGRRHKLQLSDMDRKKFDEEGKVTRWFNDQDGRVEAALQGGWQFVDPNDAKSLGFDAIHQGNTDLGSRVSKVVSRGEPVVRAYLMWIWKELYDEDQEAKEAINRRVDETLRPTNQGGQTIEGGYTPK